MFRSIVTLLVLSSVFVACGLKNENKAELSMLADGEPGLYFLGEVDSDITTSCGQATPATTTTTGTGTTTGSTGSTSTTNNTRFTVISQLIFKTKETLNLRFTYDSTQIQGKIDPQQGFVLAGGAFGKTVQGTQGTVEWFNQGINIDTALQSAQQISFFNLELTLNGTYSSTATSSNVLLSCNTLDSVNCTSGTSTTQCFTSDNKTCLVQNTSTDAKAVIIRGTIKCNAPNIVPQ
ncbi:LIC10920 family plasminogen-binding lipoprotein [Leptospira meyeri]|uniref:LIC10920 family plasminogen-binding lipoprotein n=1 Tax=Leptospira meyeri TaxID=29508 RepID=UPI000C2A1A3D|nr:hypothetical protein [Leptospira meyeri]PKA25730.1 hypothetical protein CH381_13930 [Leptospira sp. mixed culture ATI2-C-A1]PJZ80297.1 hypothetical protein CH359_13470 [Leptospira meyeri]PJZ95488.1 hypothetical protein CH358_16710 [Leptospira meyeri]PKA12487.1 hypothetical protein CH372_09080 [Leptospira meyeri]TGM64631.1 hypothetical protein EHQ94_18860 [Leptospira meyeri]